jgi:GNAT superfamily N-acetyltransferase
VIGLCFHPLIPGEPGTTTLHEGKVRAAGTDCSLERLYVHPDARRRGIGETLTRLVIDQAKAEGKLAMELWSDKKLGDAHRLYGRFGAETIGDRICHDPDQSPEWGLVIRLTIDD